MHGAPQRAVSKRDRVALWAERTGLRQLLTRTAGRDLLLVVNYHRIGDPRTGDFDSGVYSATEEEFAAQLDFLRKNHTVIGLSEAVEIAAGRGRPRGPVVLITFDDGYLDNFTTAFPMLRAAGLPATFFLATSFVGSSCLAWWDRIARAIRLSCVPAVRLTYPHRVQIALGDREDAIRRLLAIYKSPETGDTARFMSELFAACECPEQPENVPRLFLDWDEAAEMVRGGMTIGSHTHSHRLLSRLPIDEQVVELRQSRSLLEQRLGTVVNTVAYPVGSHTAFNSDTFTAMEQTGYALGFSFYGGGNPLPVANPCDIRRNGVGHPTLQARFRFQMAWAAHAGGYWF